jgi:hypothetical protein
MKMKDVKRNKQTGKGYKITTFSKEYAERNGHSRYWLALFNPEAHTAHEGWYAEKLRHAKGDGEAFIAEAA